MKKATLIALVLFLIVSNSFAQKGAKKIVLFNNVMVFDGTTDELLKRDVLVEDNIITVVSEEALAVIASENTIIIDGRGMTLMPGLIDAHVHLAITEPIATLRDKEDWMYWGAVSGREAEKMLLRGFTTVRDAGGPAIGLAHAIDQGRLPGPRVYASGPVISQTSGHGEHRHYTEPHPNMADNEPHFFHFGRS